MKPLPLDPADLRFDPPALPLDSVAEVLAEHWGITGRLRPLEGERDQNTRVTTDDGSDYVLKIASPSEDPQVADLQCAALRHVADTDAGLGVPNVVPALDGSDIVMAEIVTAEIGHGGAATASGVGGGHGAAPVRLLTFVRGVTFGGAGSLETDALFGVGASQGRLARAFTGFRHPGATNFMAWALDAAMVHHDELWDELSAEGRAAAGPFRDRVTAVASQVEVDAASGHDGIRRQVLHNDGHRGNLLRASAGSTEVVGVIDFGDIAHTCVVADLAICVASFVDEHPEQADAAAAITAGYDRWMSLTDPEIDVLVDLALLRIVLGLLLVEFQTRHAPPRRLGEIAGELPGYRANMAAWGTLHVERTTETIRERVTRERAIAERGGQS